MICSEAEPPSVLQGASMEHGWVEFPVLASALDLEFVR